MKLLFAFASLSLRFARFSVKRPFCFLFTTDERRFLSNSMPQTVMPRTAHTMPNTDEHEHDIHDNVDGAFWMLDYNNIINTNPFAFVNFKFMFIIQ